MGVASGPPTTPKFVAIRIKDGAILTTKTIPRFYTDWSTNLIALRGALYHAVIPGFSGSVTTTPYASPPLTNTLNKIGG